MALLIPTLVKESVEVSVKDNKIIFVGNIDDISPDEYLTPFIQQANDQAVSQGIKSIIVDITGLNFLNSSGIKVLVDWVIKISKLPDDKKYTITFLCSSKFMWQEASISTIMFLNPSQLKKEIV